jgi:hypothetical protein
MIRRENGRSTMLFKTRSSCLRLRRSTRASRTPFTWIAWLHKLLGSEHCDRRSLFVVHELVASQVMHRLIRASIMLSSGIDPGDRD